MPSGILLTLPYPQVFHKHFHILWYSLSTSIASGNPQYFHVLWYSLSTSISYEIPSCSQCPPPSNILDSMLAKSERQLVSVNFRVFLLQLRLFPGAKLMCFKNGGWQPVSIIAVPLTGITRRVGGNGLAAITAEPLSELHVGSEGSGRVRLLMYLCRNNTSGRRALVGRDYCCTSVGITRRRVGENWSLAVTAVHLGSKNSPRWRAECH